KMKTPYRLLLVFLLVWTAWASEPPEGEDLSFFVPDIPKVETEDVIKLLGQARALYDKASESPATAQAVATALSVAVVTLPPVPLYRALRLAKDIPADAQKYLPAAVDLLAGIRSFAIAPACLDRPGIPHTTAGQFKYLIAANLFDCEAIMPYWTLEVLRLALLLQGDQRVLSAFFHNTSSVHVPPEKGLTHISIYESGSTDNTVLWLQVAEALWTAAGIRSFVVTNGSLTRQTLMDPYNGKFYKQHRIQFLATLRNAALEPLYGAPRGAYDYVYFINDVFFCAADLFRLSHLKADIACGLDFEVWVGEKKGRMPGVTQRFRRSLLSTPATASTAAVAAAAAKAKNSSSATPVWHAAMKRMSEVHLEESARQAAADARTQVAKVKPRYEFYDTWVSRDLGGNPFVKVDPITRDTRTIDGLHRGWPIPVKCCWNGAAVMSAIPLANGLRFRAGLVEDGECDISECSLFCEDYRRLGAKRVAVDPSVRVAYLPWTKEFHGKLPGGVGAKVPWVHLERNSGLTELEKQWSDTQGCMSVQCIPLRRGTEEADIHSFRVIDLAANNYTHMFLEQLKQPPSPPFEPQSCNQIMGPYGATNDGSAFDDLSISLWGKNPIQRVTYTANSTLNSLQVHYGTASAPAHGGSAGDPGSLELQPGEYIISALVHFDDTAVHGMVFGTSKRRSVTIGGQNYTMGILPRGVSKAIATPCPGASAHVGRYKLIAFAGTADKVMRSLTLIWS
ncbi:hypothetical protein Agub_g3408, partial [Astrephomene gubernaculifera]